MAGKWAEDWFKNNVAKFTRDDEGKGYGCMMSLAAAVYELGPIRINRDGNEWRLDGKIVSEADIIKAGEVQSARPCLTDEEIEKKWRAR